MKLTGPGGDTDPFIGPHLLLPSDKARHVGEAVAMVVAETVEQALDAPRPSSSTTRSCPGSPKRLAALQPGAPAVWDEVPDNCFIDTWFGDAQATQQAFAKADHVVVDDDRHPARDRRDDGAARRARPLSMRPLTATRCMPAPAARYARRRRWQRRSGSSTDQLRVLSYDVGGNFGARNRAYVEFGLVLWASKKIGRPVKFTATRSEAFLTDYQGRDLATTVELALTKDGKFLAMRADNVSNVGARAVSLSPLGKGAGLITGSYDIPAATLRARAVFTNTMPTNAYRSSGRPEVNFAIERLIDKAARRARLRPRRAARARTSSAATDMPYMNAVGAEYDSGTYGSQYGAGDEHRRLGRLRGAQGGRRSARQAARASVIAPYVEILDWRRRVSAPTSPYAPKAASTS